MIGWIAGNGASSITPEGEDHKACFSEKMAHFDPTLPRRCKRMELTEVRPLHLTSATGRALIESRMQRRWINWIGLFSLWAGVLSLSGAHPSHELPMLRYPIRVVLSADESELVVANSRSGTVSALDLEKGKVYQESYLCPEISDMHWEPVKKEGFFLDPQNHRLLRAIQNKEGGFDLEGSWKTVGDPRYLEASPDGRQLAVSGTWSRQIQIMNVPGDSLPPELLLTLDLSFNPGPMVFVPDEKLLLVMHAFGGLLAWVELDTGSVRSVVELPMNNFGRPKIQTTHQGPVLWLAGQSLNPRATTFQTEVMWGVLMDNQIRSIPVSLALDPMTPVHQMGRVYGMGDETGPGGDPGSVWSTRNGTLIAALEGVDKIALRPRLDQPGVQRIAVGDRPVDMAINREETRLYVANQFSDTISIVDLEENRSIMDISLGTQPMLEIHERGERVFYDAELSLRGWFSCHSCHPKGHSSGLLNDNLGDDHFGAPKRILSLLGIKDTAPFAWKGSLSTLEDQISKSFRDTLLHADNTQEKALEIGAFLRTLKSPPSWRTLRDEVDTDQIIKGKRLFRELGCQECHRPPTYTSDGRYKVGIQDEAGEADFNPPSLRGLSQRDDLFHDNRAHSIEAVLVDHGHPDPTAPPIAQKDLEPLIHFLLSL